MRTRCRRGKFLFHRAILRYYSDQSQKDAWNCVWRYVIIFYFIPLMARGAQTKQRDLPNRPESTLPISVPGAYRGELRSLVMTNVYISEVFSLWYLLFTRTRVAILCILTASLTMPFTTLSKGSFITLSGDYLYCLEHPPRNKKRHP